MLEVATSCMSHGLFFYAEDGRDGMPAKRTGGWLDMGEKR